MGSLNLLGVEEFLWSSGDCNGLCDSCTRGYRVAEEAQKTMYVAETFYRLQVEE